MPLLPRRLYTQLILLVSCILLATEVTFGWVNAYVVKPVRFGDFIEAVKEIGIFWALINEAPPTSEENGL